jgi:hypothetical protein
MWETLTEAFLKIYDLTRSVDHHSKRIAVLEQKADELHEAFGRFTLAYQKDCEKDEADRKLLLA